MGLKEDENAMIRKRHSQTPQPAQDTNAKDLSEEDNWAATWQNQQSSLRPAKAQINLGIPQSGQSLRCPHEETLSP